MDICFDNLNLSKMFNKCLVTDGLSYWFAFSWAILGHLKYENAFQSYQFKKTFQNVIVQ